MRPELYSKENMQGYNSMRTFTAMLHREGEIYVAECPEVGAVSQGLTIDEALANLKEATELYLEESEYIPHSRTLITTFEAAVNV